MDIKKTYTDVNEAKKRLLAVRDLFTDISTTREKVAAAGVLIKGIHEKIDTAFERAESAFAKLEAAQTGAVVQFSGETLPETTEEEKKRKKAFLLFLKYWKELQGEVVRVEKEFDSNKNGSEKNMWGKIFGGVKGPLGIITILAIGIAATLQTTAVKVEIVNNGCDSMEFPESIPDLPGLALPKDPITTSASGIATVPPVSVSVDTTQGRTAAVSALGFSGSYEIPDGVTALTLDGVSLLGVKTEINLSDKKNHTLAVTCKRAVSALPVQTVKATAVPSAPVQSASPADGAGSLGTGAP